MPTAAANRVLAWRTTYHCPTPIADGRTCDHAFRLTMPDTGRARYQLACPRCGATDAVTITAAREPTPRARPTPRHPPPCCPHRRRYETMGGIEHCADCGVPIAADG